MLTITAITNTTELRIIVMDSLTEMSTYNPELATLLDEIDSLNDHQLESFLFNIGPRFAYNTESPDAWERRQKLINSRIAHALAIALTR